MTIYFQNRLIIIWGKGLAVLVGDDGSVPGAETLPESVTVTVGRESVFLAVGCQLLLRKLSFVTVMLCLPVPCRSLFPPFP